MNHLKKVFAFPWFLYLLPCFFYLLAIGDNGLHPTWAHIAIPFFVLLLIVGLTHLLSIKHSKHPKKYLIFIFLLLSSYLFFGNIKDLFPAGSFIQSYYVLCPILFIFPFGVYWLLKENARRIENLFSYLNTLMIVLSIMQIFLSQKNISAAYKKYMQPIALTETKLSVKPSIYFILFDEYPGQISLKHYFNFDNQLLIQHLRSRGYYVFDTINSNYDKTVYSINSTLNLQYVDTALYTPVKNYATYLKNFTSIRRNVVTEYLEHQGYTINNLSLFSVGDHETITSFPLLYTSNKQLFRQVFHERIKHDLLWKLYCGKYRIESMYDKYLLHTHHQNNQIIAELMKAARLKTNQPIFHFAHLLMPHEPVFTDSAGNLYDMENEEHLSDTTKKSLGYLKYTNTRMMQLADSIQENDPKAIVILFSDHGIRDTPPENSNYYCNNFMALRLPDENYAQLKKIRSNVNLFRVIFNQYFNQQLPLLKDECFSIDEENNRFKQQKPF